MAAKALIIGLDSGTWRLMRPWIKEGRLPQIARLVEDGASGELKSVVPPVTALAWPSFLTGKNPGGHGIYSFMKRRPGTYEMMPNNALDVRGETLADILSRHGRRVALMNVPMTYPPRQTNGIIVSGMYTPSIQSRFTFPETLKDELLNRFDYEIEYSNPVRAGIEQAFVSQVTRIEEKRAEAAEYLLEQEDWDLFSVVFRGTDVLSHYFWRAQDRSHPGFDSGFAEEFGHVLEDHYEQMDAVIGRLMRAAGDDCTVVIMSDHGSGGLKRIIYLDNWFLRQGLMRVKRTPDARIRYFLLTRGITISNAVEFLKRIGLWRWIRKSVGREARLKVSGKLFGSTAIDWTKTLAYPVGIVGAINVNLKGREPLGAVSPGAEYERVRQRIVETLLDLRDPDTGEPVVSEVLYREEVYNGPCVEKAPDLIVVWRDHAYKATFILGGSNKVMSPVLSGSYSGFHTMDGILVIKGPGIKAGFNLENAELIDIAPTILALLGLPIPEDMDGKVLTGLFEQQPQLNYESMPSALERAESDLYSSEEEQFLTQRLKDLGYL